MGKAIKDLLGAVLFHVVIVAFLGLLGVIVWDVGVASLTPLHSISYWTSTAIMLGLYIINFFIKIQINRVLALRNQKYFIDKIVKFYIENKKDTD